jgi:ribosomal protein S27E
MSERDLLQTNFSGRPKSGFIKVQITGSFNNKIIFAESQLKIEVRFLIKIKNE